ncbi:MAG: PQQ-like beta-propeller repeat protein [Planctomycetes bacterium]|nr:PQQ-like beta-propeller repeat protein [Planctomycetota bacterium]
MRSTRFILAAAVFLAAAETRAENWPHWRGPFHNGSTTETDLPATWGETENVAWVTPMPGSSGATPIVWGDRVFISSADEKTGDLLAIGIRVADGKEIWRHAVAKDRRFPNNNMASPSPATDGRSVVFLYGTGDLAAFDLDGRRLWARNVEPDRPGFSIQFGYSSSPLLHGGRLYVQVLQHEDPKRWRSAPVDRPGPLDSYLLGIDPATGEDLWKQIRRTDAADESKEAYSTPIPWSRDGRDEILIFGGDGVTAHDPATGAEVWRWIGLNPRKQTVWRTVPSALAGEGLVFLSSAKHNPHFFAVRPGKGTLGADHVAWKIEEPTPDASTPLLYRGRLYILQDDRKIVSCREPKTGREIWNEALGGRSVIRASLTGADGKIYAMDQGGTVYVLAAGDSFRLLHRIDMGKDPSRSTIVAAAGRLFIRTAEKLHCIAKRK